MNADDVISLLEALPYSELAKVRIWFAALDKDAVDRLAVADDEQRSSGAQGTQFATAEALAESLMEARRAMRMAEDSILLLRERIQSSDGSLQETVLTDWYRELGRKGGRAGGQCKVRGGRAYYANLRKLRTPGHIAAAQAVVDERLATPPSGEPGEGKPIGMEQNPTTKPAYTTQEIERRRRCGNHCTSVQEREIADYLLQGNTDSMAAEHFSRCRRTIARIRAKYFPDS